MRNFLIILFIAIIVLGCGSGRKRYEAGLQSLEGKHIDEFYRAWGPPNSKADFSTGDYIVSWGKQSRVQEHIPPRHKNRRCSLMGN